MRETDTLDNEDWIPEDSLDEALSALAREAEVQRIEARRSAAQAVLDLALAKGFADLQDARRALTAEIPEPEGGFIYVNPEDPSLTWPGRGRKPGWLKALEEQGVDIATLRQ